ncbi:hypothetical protein [Lysinibacillus capsici]|uniref:hypothetical protein n=1 Tax=Lysinibacillus capsici TaxID=2115968 RepID=UPI001CDA0E0D|nr:hypothetical protein [Lysinibacillus capsici]
MKEWLLEKLDDASWAISCEGYNEKVIHTIYLGILVFSIVLVHEARDMAQSVGFEGDTSFSSLFLLSLEACCLVSFIVGLILALYRTKVN